MKRRWQQFAYKHQDGIEATLFTVGIVLAICIVLGIVASLAKVGLETGCNQTASELGLEDSDYRFWSDACFVTLEDGRRVNVDSVRAPSGGTALPGEDD